MAVKLSHKSKIDSIVFHVAKIDGDVATIECFARGVKYARPLAYKDIDPDLQVGDLVEVTTLTRKLDRALEEVTPD